MHNKRRYNAWTQQMMIDMRASLEDAANNDGVKGAIMTGAGDYYCAYAIASSIGIGHRAAHLLWAWAIGQRCCM